MEDIFKAIFIILFVALIIVFQPLALIWGVNTLVTAAAIPYNFWSWLAVVILQVSLKSKVTLNK